MTQELLVQAIPIELTGVGHTTCVFLDLSLYNENLDLG